MWWLRPFVLMAKNKSKDKCVKDKSYAHPIPISLSTTSPSFTRITSLFTYLSFYNNSYKPSKLQGIFDPLSNSVIVHDKHNIEKLWKQGFFGKGNLSRSEPTWDNRNNLAKKNLETKGKGNEKGKAILFD